MQHRDERGGLRSKAPRRNRKRKTRNGHTAPNHAIQLLEKKHWREVIPNGRETQRDVQAQPPSPFLWSASSRSSSPSSSPPFSQFDSLRSPETFLRRPLRFGSAFHLTFHNLHPLAKPPRCWNRLVAIIAAFFSFFFFSLTLLSKPLSTNFSSG
jgi:hypothetical protein